MSESPDSTTQITTGRDSLTHVGRSILLALVMLLVTLVVGWFLTRHIEGFGWENAALARFFILVLLGICAALFLFYVMETFGKLSGSLFNLNIQFGGPAALFLLVLLLGMKIITPTDRNTLAVYLFPNDEELIPNVSKSVIVHIEVGSDIRSVAFNEFGMALIENVPSDIVAARKLAVRVRSAEYRVPRKFKDGNGRTYLPIERKTNRVDIPLERIPIPPSSLVKYKACRVAGNGIETQGELQSVSKTSPWMGGGYDPARWCSDVIGSLKGKYQNSEFRVLGTSESKKSRCKPFNCPEYKYVCKVEIMSQPTYKFARSPECGVEE